MEANGSSKQSTDLDKKIYTQIEYYFGNHNLLRDKFMQEQLKLDDGWIQLETLVKFNRLSALSKDFAVITNAVKLSPNGLLEVSENNLKIRRKPDLPIPEANAFKESIKGSTIYVKGFPLDVGLDEIKEWFESKASGKVENIHLRRNIQKKFKGSVFAVFDTSENAQKFVDLPGHKYQDNDLIVLTKTAYFAKKQEDRKEMKLQNKLSKESEAKQDDEEFKNLEFQEGCLLKFSGDLDSFTSREDVTEVFKGHGQIKWIDFTRGAKEGFVRFTKDAQGALERASAAQLAVEKKGESKEKSKEDEPKKVEEASNEKKDDSAAAEVPATAEAAAEVPATAETPAEAPAEAPVKAPAVAEAPAVVPLQLRGRDVAWQVLEGEAARQVWIRLLKEQQETMNKRRGARGGGRRGGNHGGRGGGRGGRGGRRDNREFQGKKTKFESDDEDGDDAGAAKKRPLESEQTSQEPQAKQAKTD